MELSAWRSTHGAGVEERNAAGVVEAHMPGAVACCRICMQAMGAGRRAPARGVTRANHTPACGGHYGTAMCCSGWRTRRGPRRADFQPEALDRAAATATRSMSAWVPVTPQVIVYGRAPAEARCATGAWVFALTRQSNNGGHGAGGGFSLLLSVS